MNDYIRRQFNFLYASVHIDNFYSILARSWDLEAAEKMLRAVSIMFSLIVFNS